MQVIIPPKAKADFEQYKLRYFTEMEDALLFQAHLAISLIENFDRLPFAMQQGVYLEYLREKGIYAEARQSGMEDQKLFFAYHNGHCIRYSGERHTEPTTALAAAINAAFETLNAGTDA
jgi:hypothetical protein